MRQLVQLRWLAVLGQVVAILAAHFALGIELPLVPMLALAGLLALANLLFALTLRRLWFVEGELLMALLLDMAVLSGQLYLSGGATNPFLSLYLLQVALGAILLRPAMVSLLVAVVSLNYALLTFNHLPLHLPQRLWGVPVDLRLVGEWISFTMVAILLVLFITRISRNLAARDAYLAEFAQRAAEEDGIVRMGLFASGAAHELSTPLSSLSVLVTDWQHDDALARDPRFREELAEAQAEVQRCKDIVSDILDSAGQARGEAMGATPIKPLLEEIASSWQSLHASTTLRYVGKGLGNTRVAAEPALRQAIWNLLENAWEISSRPIELIGEVVDDRLLISVLDDGHGFSPEQLARLGKLGQSSKGAGHGLGLFLASNVARRLGGALEAFNRPEGGATVKMVLPVVSSGSGED